MALKTKGGPPHLCMIHEAIGSQNAIAKVSAWGVRQALAAGWRVTVVAKFLDESLRGEVEWLRLTVPPRGFFVQWTTARRFITSALGGRTFDVVHAHQPQVASLSDVFQCHFLTRVAFERNCLETRPGLRPALVRVQERGVLHAEDYYYRRWNPRTRMLFCSELIGREFARLYGALPRSEVLMNSCPPPSIPDAARRQAARAALLSGAELSGKRVVGFLGGLQERKGVRRILDAVAAEPDLFLLLGGSFCEGFADPRLAGRMRAVGLVKDTAQFYHACDAVAVPSHFDPCPLVVFEAVANGAPVIATEGVGNLHRLVSSGAGLAWEPGSPLSPLVRRASLEADGFHAGARRLADELSESRQGGRLLRIYEEVRAEKLSGVPAAAAPAVPAQRGQVS